MSDVGLRNVHFSCMMYDSSIGCTSLVGYTCGISIQLHINQSLRITDSEHTFDLSGNCFFRVGGKRKGKKRNAKKTSLGRLELPISRLTVGRFNQLSHRDVLVVIGQVANESM